jgi:hypothetical protein
MSESDESSNEFPYTISLWEASVNDWSRRTWYGRFLFIPWFVVTVLGTVLTVLMDILVLLERLFGVLKKYEPPRFKDGENR